MGKTLLKHFTFIDTSYQMPSRQTDMPNDSLAELVGELQHALNLAKEEVLSPREKTIEDLLSKAKLIQ